MTYPKSIIGNFVVSKYFRRDTMFLIYFQSYAKTHLGNNFNYTWPTLNVIYQHASNVTNISKNFLRNCQRNIKTLFSGEL